MLNGDISKEGANSVAFNLTALCSSEKSKGWFKEGSWKLVPSLDNVAGFLSRLSVRFNMHLLVDDKVPLQEINEWIEQNYLPITKAWSVPDRDHYRLFASSIFVESTLVVSEDPNHFIVGASVGEVLYYSDANAGWCALVDYLEGRMV